MLAILITIAAVLILVPVIYVAGRMTNVIVPKGERTGPWEDDEDFDWPDDEPDVPDEEDDRDYPDDDEYPIDYRDVEHRLAFPRMYRDDWLALCMLEREEFRREMGLCPSRLPISRY